ALLSTFAVLGVLIRDKLIHDELPSRQVRAASRHAILLTVLFLLALLLQSVRWLTWWNLIILLVVAGLIEMFIVSYKRNA
ncbi:MAG: hypothetical protein V1763_01710, partial [Parcubacteria group bacterium]